MPNVCNLHYTSSISCDKCEAQLISVCIFEQSRQQSCNFLSNGTFTWRKREKFYSIWYNFKLYTKLQKLLDVFAFDEELHDRVAV